MATLMVSPELYLQKISNAEAATVHDMYIRCPHYFELLGSKVPTLEEVEHELETIKLDHRRTVQVIKLNEEVVGLLDYKTSYPDPYSATVSLLLVDERLQGRGIASSAMKQLERLLKPSLERIYTVVYGANADSKSFWQGKGYHHVRDAGPALSWFEKVLHEPV